MESRQGGGGLQGSTYWGQNFTIHNVLFIQALKCNLISLGKLIHEANYFITLFDNLCVV